MRLLNRLHTAFSPTLDNANAVAAAAWLKPNRRDDRRLLLFVLVGGGCLYIQNYLVINGAAGLPQLLFTLGAEQAARDVFIGLTRHRDSAFLRQLYWALGVSICLFVLPALAVILSGGRLRDYGLRRPPAGEGRVLVLLMIAMMPIVLVAATQPEFQSYYPFYQPPQEESLWPRFVVFECLYLLQFLAVEFFFRGFLIHGAKHRFGAWAILLPLIPYMMVHFGKPAAEALGSIVAGVVLGYLSLRTGSILYGVVLHAAAALAMDLASLSLQGRLF